jgi:hypothetical protein
MRRTAVIIASLFFSIPAPAREKNRFDPRLAIRVEYRQDALDYDDMDKRFFRESASLYFMKSSASFTYVHIGTNKENRFTWNINIQGISPYFDCILGHYYINFGAGLIVGKKTAISPDPFTRRLIISNAGPFIPCSSGNPLYCFHGITAGLTLPFQDVSISLRGFFSFRNRYVRNDIYYRDVTGSSFNSILIRTKKDYRYSEPAEINDYGSILVIRAVEHLTVQAYFIYTAMRRSNNHRLLWNYGDRDIQEGEKAFYAYGFYSEYHDDYITLFIEFGFPHQVLTTAAGGCRTQHGYGLLYGLYFRHHACFLSFRGKHADKNFYSPYSSGTNYAETAFMADIAVRPLKPLSLGCAFFADKKISPTGYEQYLPFLRRELAFLKYTEAGKGYLSLKFSHIENGKKNGIERYLQLRTSAGIFLMKSILFSFNGTVQQKGTSGYSASLHVGIKLCLLRYITVNLRYSRYFITPGNSLYSAESPLRGSISNGNFVDSSSNIMTCIVSARYRENMLFVRYQHQFTNARTKQSRIEASGILLL